MIQQNELTNDQVKNHVFLESMYRDSYFPPALVDKCKSILLDLCKNIETQKPASLRDLYILTHASTNALNDLQDEFFEHDSELEGGAAECIAMDFMFIAHAYGFEANMEELMATREF